jgi:hypothetical protein
LAAGLFPQLVARCSDTLARTPIKCTLLGAVTLGPLVAVGFFISNKAPNGVGKALGLAIVLFAALAALFGSAGLALARWAGLKSVRDEEDPWRRVLRGGIVLALTFVMPFLGTFLVMPPGVHRRLWRLSFRLFQADIRPSSLAHDPAPVSSGSSHYFVKVYPTSFFKRLARRCGRGHHRL